MIETLKNQILIGYGCIVVATAEKDNIEQRKQYENSKTYEFTSRMLSPDNILMDVITSKNRVRPQLNEIIDIFQASGRTNPSGVVAVANISEFGTTPKEIAQNYSKLNAADIGILIFDSEELSTVDYGCHYTKDSLQRSNIVETLAQNIPAHFKTKRGRKQREVTITKDFITVYWLYETYRLAEKNTYKNKLIMLNKVSFKDYCRTYEESPEYATDEQDQARQFDLIDLPKRFGTVPENFGQLIQLRKQGVPLQKA